MDPKKISEEHQKTWGKEKWKMMLGNLFRESGVVRQLTDTASNALMYIVVILLGTSVGGEILIVAFFPQLSGYRDAFAFIVLIVILFYKPTGLLGEKTTEKV